MRIAGVIDELERWPRQGASQDDPEGARFVVISDTALAMIIRELRAGVLDDAEYLAPGPRTIRGTAIDRRRPRVELVRNVAASEQIK
jgi:hypothetical protein